MTLIGTDPDTGLEPLEFAVTKNLAAKNAAQRDEILANPGFGTNFTDHMVDICWSVSGGWHRPRVQPYGPITLDPAAAVLHYGQEIFEGIKAYRHEDGSIHTFRPDQNGRRLQRSARRLALPELPVTYFIQSLRELDRRRRRVGAVAARTRACTCGPSCSPRRRSSACAPRTRSTTT